MYFRQRYTIKNPPSLQVAAASSIHGPPADDFTDFTVEPWRNLGGAGGDRVVTSQSVAFFLGGEHAQARTLNAKCKPHPPTKNTLLKNQQQTPLKIGASPNHHGVLSGKFPIPLKGKPGEPKFAGIVGCFGIEWLHSCIGYTGWWFQRFFHFHPEN